MNHMTVNNFFDVLVSKDVASGSTLADGTLVDSYSDLTDGEIVVLDVDNTVISQPDGAGSLASIDRFRLAQRVGDSIRYSDWITQDNITNITTEEYSAPTQQTDYIGYNGTSGAIEAINSNMYSMHLHFKSLPAGNNTQADWKPAYYESDDSATGAEVAIGLVSSLLGHLKRDPEQRVIPSAVCDSAVTAANDFTGDTTVVKGLKKITVAEESSGANDAGTYGSGSADVAVGDFVRIGSVAGGTALTDNVYKAVAITGDNDAKILELDRPIVEDSGTYAAGTSDIEVIPASDAATADFGIKLLGVARTNVNPKNKDYYVQRWSVSLEDFGTTTVTNSQAPFEGYGSPYQVAELEYTAQFLRGNFENQSYWKWENDVSASTSATYDIIEIDYFESTNPRLVAGKKQPKKLYIFPYIDSDMGTELAATLNTLSDYSVSF